MIYVVEDDKAIRNLVLYALQEKNYQVRGFEDGLNVVESLKNENVDLLILDIMLPEKDGIEILKEVRKFSDIPVIILTAKTDEFDKVLGLERPCRHFYVDLRHPRLFYKYQLLLSLLNLLFYTNQQGHSSY